MTENRHTEKLRGVLAVFQTPFDERDESIDASTLEKQIDWIFEQGANGIVMAMASETLRLDSDERQELAELACEFSRQRGAVVISVGAESNHVVGRYAKHAQDSGADAVMAIPPVSVALSNDQLADYYRRLIEAVAIPVIVQDASNYVGRPMSVTMQASLLNEYGPERVQYKPEASPVGPLLTALLQATSGQARVFEGSGGISLIDNFRRGVVGTMPAADVVDALVAMWNALEAGDDQRAYRIQGPLGAMIVQMVNLDAYMTIEKYVLVKRGIFKNMHMRGPVGYKLDDQTCQEIDRLYDLLMDAVNN